MRLKAIDGAKSSANISSVTIPNGEEMNSLIPFMAIFGYRDQREIMERPFFSINKSRTEPINYTSPDGAVTVKVSADPEYGLATIWDADILIYLASVISEMKRQGINDIPRKVTMRPRDLLCAIGRSTGGREYQLLAKAMDRLVAVSYTHLTLPTIYSV